MKWYLNDLYSGDSIGQISVISLTPLLTKALFQTPSATLMLLDSSIVQLDIYSNFLLVSTKTRTYLCDTLQEQYRQIGKKLRDGNFGACFYYKINSNVCGVSQGDDEKTLRAIKTNNIPLVNREEVKIYCARPGSRLWEANFDSSVVCTHQFRDSLTVNAAPVIHLQENENSPLNITNVNENVSVNFNFEKIFVFADYILTFRTDGIYIFDVKVPALLYWTNYFSDIKDVKILDNMIYIWLENNILKILSLLDIESFVTKILSRKQYSLCAQFCLLWMDELSVLINDNKLQVLKVLHEKLTDKKLANAIEPLMEKFGRNKIYSKKLQNGIYVVDNVHHRENCSTKNNVILKSPVDIDSNVNTTEIHEFPMNESSNVENKNTEEIDPYSDKNYLINIFNKQYQINKMHNTVTVPKFQELMQNRSLEELKKMFDLFLEYSEDGSDSRQWITTQILKFVNLNTTEHLKNLDCNSKLFHFISECFIYLNKSNDSCKCSFPLSSASLKMIHFYEIGCEIIGKYDNFSTLCKEVPSMYRFPLENCHQNLITLLPLLIQYNDSSLFKKYCTKFTYDMWDEAMKYFVKLKCNICLNCDSHIKNSLNTTWSNFAKCVLNSIGGPSTLKLLSRYSKYIPTGELDIDFYQACIFVSCLPNNQNDNITKYSKFLEDVQKHELRKAEFDLLILKYLKSKNVGDDKRNNIINVVDTNCPVCDISLQSLLFKDTVKLKCGHFSHKICAISTEICPSCSTRM
ncbi:hypothetical protein AMK59_6336 [Oryctes borbonicus]|uniref:RING-type domain-containing protein n=1 Tax=Oryctes borbonicus TaxID=1629725 RepID=A0A0T6B396_9SCAR|nr:hypothetical protein AMK59_6336 [Oryctes borbonicus]